MDVLAKLSIKKALEKRPEISKNLNSNNREVVAVWVSVLAKATALSRTFIDQNLTEIKRFI